MFLRLLLLFALVPLVELWLLIELTKLTSLAWTIVLVMSTGVIGMNLVRWQGMKAWQDVQQQLANRQSPSQAIVAGVLVLVAGAFLLTPGILTDTAGFLLLVPAVRRGIAGWLQKRMISRGAGGVGGAQGPVWFSSFTIHSGTEPHFTSEQDIMSEPTDAAERPSVRVIDPNAPKLDE